jgi:hypothetical protein
MKLTVVKVDLLEEMAISIAGMKKYARMGSIEREVVIAVKRWISRRRNELPGSIDENKLQAA